MEPAQGYRLSDIMATYRGRRELPAFDLVVDWFWQACRALGDLHETGVVHRGIGPAAVIVGSNDQVQLARIGQAPRPPSGGIGDFGTPGGLESLDYAAPELREGRFVDHRADLFALGTTFYELLTLARHSETPRPASTINRTVPPAFDEVLERLMADSPEDRYSCANEVLAVIEDLKAARRLEGAPSFADESHRSAPETPVPRVALIVAGMVVGAAAGTAVGYYLDLLIPAAVAVGAIVGAVVGFFTNSKT